MLFIPLFSLPYATLSLCFLFFLSRRCHLSVFLCCLVLPSSLFFSVFPSLFSVFPSSLFYSPSSLSLLPLSPFFIVFLWLL
jgi:hypothetical protein